MKPEDVMKAMERCIISKDCFGCPYNDGTNSICIDDILNDALALLLKKDADIERLKAQKYMAYPDGRIEMIPTVESVRADTVQKMQERLKALLFPLKDHRGTMGLVVMERDIDQVANEILEGNE
jgi:hypothetical protein